MWKQDAPPGFVAKSHLLILWKMEARCSEVAAVSVFVRERPDCETQRERMATMWSGSRFAEKQLQCDAATLATWSLNKCGTESVVTSYLNWHMKNHTLIWCNLQATDSTNALCRSCNGERESGIRPILTWVNTPNRFFGFFPHLSVFLIFSSSVFNICVYLGFWGVEAALCKIWWILGQNPRRNNLSKLTTFDPFFQLLHSAMFGWT